MSLFSGALNFTAAVICAKEWDEMMVKAALNKFSAVGGYDVRLNRRGSATAELVWFDGSEILYSHGEAFMGNASALVRFVGEPLVVASTSAALYGSKKEKTQIGAKVSLFSGALNFTAAVICAKEWDEMMVKAALNKFSAVGGYDVRFNRRGSAMAELVWFDGSEILYSHGEAFMGNASALVRFVGEPLVVASTSAALYGSKKEKTQIGAKVSLFSGALNFTAAVICAKEWDEMMVKAALNKFSAVGGYDVRLNRRGSATAELVWFDGSEIFYSHGRGLHGERFGSLCASWANHLSSHQQALVSLRVKGGKDTDWCEGVVV